VLRNVLSFYRTAWHFRCAGLTPDHLHKPIVLISVSLRFLKPLGPVQAYNGNSLLLHGTSWGKTLILIFTAVRKSSFVTESRMYTLQCQRFLFGLQMDISELHDCKQPLLRRKVCSDNKCKYFRNQICSRNVL
jgi:hypothetical protein